MKFPCALFFLSAAAIGNGFVLQPPKFSVHHANRYRHRCQYQPPTAKTPSPSPSTTRRHDHHRHQSKTDDTTTTTTNPPEIKLYNSLTRTKAPLLPVTPGHISMYTCGPTVYDHAHVGNFRAFLTYDVLKRVLHYFGLTVHHICNLTDVDDKIIARCTREGVSLKELTDRYAGLFLEDLEALNVVPADGYPRATEHIDEMVEMVQDLERAELAYRSGEGSWYFRVEGKEGYGKQLVDLDLDAGSMTRTATAGAAACDGQPTPQDADEYDAEKSGLRDFALWKAYKPSSDRDDATWDTPIGRGRPGWHLECSAMAKKYFGDTTLDVHCGGTDLRFPHHENEIAQSEGASALGKKFCNCWLHNGFVTVGEEKMSKSTGNFMTLRGACPTGEDVRAYRYLVVSSQYRNPLRFTEGAVAASKGALRRMDNVRKMLEDVLGDGVAVSVEVKGEEENKIVTAVNHELNNFETALADDLSMPRAAASLFGVVKAAEIEFKRHKKAVEKVATNEDGNHDAPLTLDLVGLMAARDAMDQMDKVFGIFYQVPKVRREDGTENEDEEEEDDGTVPEEVMELVRSRTAAKDAKDWGLADSLRSQITKLGFAVKDVKDGDAIVSRV